MPRVGELLISIKAELAQFRRTFVRAGQLVNEFRKDVRNMAGQVRLAFLAFGSAFILRRILEPLKAMAQIRAGLVAATDSARLAAEEFEFVRSVAIRLGRDLRTTGITFSRLAAAAKGTRLEGKAIRDVFEATVIAMTAVNASAFDTAGAIFALQQIVSKGRLQTEELRRQLAERLPGAFQIAARAMGVTTAQLDKMLELGQVTAEDFLPKFARALRDQFGAAAVEASQNIIASLNRVNTAVFELINAFGDAGLTKAFSDAARKIADVTNTFATKVRENGKIAKSFIADFGLGALGVTLVSIGSVVSRFLFRFLSATNPVILALNTLIITLFSSKFAFDVFDRNLRAGRDSLQKFREEIEKNEERLQRIQNKAIQEPQSFSQILKGTKQVQAGRLLLEKNKRQALIERLLFGDSGTQGLKEQLGIAEKLLAKTSEGFVSRLLSVLQRMNAGTNKVVTTQSERIKGLTSFIQQLREQIKLLEGELEENSRSFVRQRDKILNSQFILPPPRAVFNLAKKNLTAAKDAVLGDKPLFRALQTALRIPGELTEKVAIKATEAVERANLELNLLTGNFSAADKEALKLAASIGLIFSDFKATSRDAERFVSQLRTATLEINKAKFAESFKDSRFELKLLEKGLTDNQRKVLTMARSFGLIKENLQGITPEIQQMTVAFAKTLDAIDAFTKKRTPLGDLKEELRQTVFEVGLIGDKLTDTNKEALRTAFSVGVLDENFKILFKDARPVIQKLAVNLKLLDDEAKRLQERTRLENLAKRINKQFDPFLRAKKDIADIIKLEKQRQITSTTASLAILAANRQLRDSIKETMLETGTATDGAIVALADYAEAARNTARQTAEAFNSAFGSIEDAFVDLLTKFKFDFKSLIESIEVDIARPLVRRGITGPLAEFVGTSILGGAPGLFGGNDFAAAAAGGTVNMTVVTPDAGSFQRNATQIKDELNTFLGR